MSTPARSAPRLASTIFFVACLLNSAFTTVLADSSKPNIILILTDDQGWGDIRSHDNDKIDTPTMDRIASEGARIDRFYVSPVCAPTRASLLTGRYSERSNIHGVTRNAEAMRPEEVTLGEIFKAAGYATGAFGKWHNGANYPHHPNGQGFDTFIGFCGGHWNTYFDTMLEKNGEPFQSKGFITNVITDFALAFIDEQHKAGKPWLCYVPYNAPHSPWQVEDKYFDKYKKRGLDDTTACAYAMVENIDDNIARLLTKIDDLKQSENTIVLFITDNGPNSARYNGDMKGRKGAVDEGGVRVPCFIRWKGKIEAGTVFKPIAAHIDILPTLVELTGVKMPETKPLDGKSIAPLLLGKMKQEDWPDRQLYRTWGGKGAVRTQRWLAVRSGDRKWELYDILADPEQKKDVVRENSAVLAKLGHDYAKWIGEATKDRVNYLPQHVGHKEWPIVTLKGHEALLEGKANAGGISYHGKSGWANDWITNWTDTKAYPSWPIEVVRAGKYEVTLHYICAQENVGAKVRVEVGGAAIEGTITESWNPPVPKVADRVSRKETYDTTWKPLKLGVIELGEGVTQLNVKALTKPGAQVMDLKAVVLRRVE
ncbi:MAG: arylsulfatase [Phycisphaeraceae bacterium]